MNCFFAFVRAVHRAADHASPAPPRSIARFDQHRSSPLFQRDAWIESGGRRRWVQAGPGGSRWAHGSGDGGLHGRMCRCWELGTTTDLVVLDQIQRHASKKFSMCTVIYFELLTCMVLIQIPAATGNHVRLKYCVFGPSKAWAHILSMLAGDLADPRIHLYPFG